MHDVVLVLLDAHDDVKSDAVAVVLLPHLFQRVRATVMSREDKHRPG